jgi:hypothetical protein
VDDVANEDLMAEISKKYLKSMLDSFNMGKNLGPYGWSMEFYLSFYDLFKKTLFR